MTPDKREKALAAAGAFLLSWGALSLTPKAAALWALDTREALSMLGLGLACLAASQFGDRE